jgi:hypothetical protein
VRCQNLKRCTKIKRNEGAMDSRVLGVGIAAAICGRARRILTNPLFSSIMEWGK